MGWLGNLAKKGAFGLTGLAATNGDATNRIARNGGFGLLGLALAKKKQPVAPNTSNNVLSVGRRKVEDLARERGLGSEQTMKRGGKVKKMAKGGSAKSSASRRGDGIARKGKTKGRFV